MTTITNPTDNELNAAFAVNVASWNDVRHENGVDVDVPARTYIPYSGFRGTPPDGPRRMIFKWTESMDAVFPWLYRQDGYRLTSPHRGHTEHRAMVYHRDGYPYIVGSADTLPRACVLALLKAHGVEVVYDRT